MPVERAAGQTAAAAAEIPAPSALRDIFLSMRPRQWTKNLIILLPLSFTVNQYWRVSEFPGFGRLAFYSLAAVTIFCLLSGAVYLINDVADAERDREHPVKRSRPVASGRLGRNAALFAMAVLVAFSLSGAFLLNSGLGLVALVYFTLMVCYSLFLKNLVLVDVLTIAAGFVLRAVAGAVAISVPVSPWLYVCTILLALFLGLGKRRHELILLDASAGRHRQILQEYSAQFVEQMIVLVGASTIMAYSLYTFTAENVPKNHAMMLTIPFVLYGVFRYMYLMYMKNDGGSPEEVLLRDRPMLLNVVFWLSSSAAILLLFR